MSTQDLKTLDIECLHGCLFALEEYTTLIAQRLARQLRGDPWMLLDAVGMLLVGPGCSWLVLLLASQFQWRWHLFVLEPCRAEEADLALKEAP